MEALFVFVIRNTFLIVLACSVAFLWHLIQLGGRQRELRRSAFFMERDRARSLRNSSLFYLLIFGSVIGLTALVQYRIKPTLPDSLLNPPTPEFVFDAVVTSTPVPQITPRLEFPTSTPYIAPTATLENPDLLPDGVLEPTATSIPVEALQEGCDDNVQINEPASGSAVSGGVSLFGRAVAFDFNFYKVEIKGPFTGNDWQSLLDGVVNAQVEGGFLGSATLTNWTPGIYQLKLTIIDSTSAEAGSCLIQIAIEP